MTCVCGSLYVCGMTRDVTWFMCQVPRYMCDMSQYMCNMTHYECDMTQHAGNVVASVCYVTRLVLFVM